MAKHDIRYGVDKKNNNEYAIISDANDNIKLILCYNPETGFASPLEPNKTYEIVEDKSNEVIYSDLEILGTIEENVPVRMEYTVVTDSKGKMSSDECSLSIIEFDEPMPMNKELGATIARQVFSTLEDDVLLDKFINGANASQPHKPKPANGNSAIDILKDRQKQETTANRRQVPVRRKPANTNIAVKPKRLTAQEQQVLTLLSQHGRNLSDMAAKGELDPTIGRDKEIEDTLQILGRRKKSSVAYTSEGGVGKTQLFQGVAQAAYDNDENTIYFELDLQGMGAGTKFRGDFEKKLLPILKNLRTTKGMLGDKKVVLCIDEIHSQMTAGQASGGTNAGEMMKPYIADGSISVIATTTTDEYKKYIESNTALKRRFQRMEIVEPKLEDTIEILNNISHLYEDHHDVTYTEDQIRTIVEYTNRYLPALRQPDKSINVMDDVGSTARRNGRDFIIDDDIAGSVAKEANLDKSFVDKSDREKFVSLKENLPKKVLGQDGALELFIKPLQGAKAGLEDQDAPWGVFVLAGPTGVGKTETVLCLAEELFGDRDAVTRIDMADFSEKHELAKLFGAPPGYVGHEEVDGKLTEAIRDKPYSILLLDEIEKAHKSIQDRLMGFFDSGKMEDNKGRTVDGRNVIVVMTSNLGADGLNKKLRGVKGFGAFDNKDLNEDGSMDMKSKSLLKSLKQETEDAMSKHFRPEFVGRIKAMGGVINYVPLEEEIVKSLTKRKLQKIEDGMRNNPQGVNLKDASIEFSDKLIDELMVEGYNPQYGMRNMNSEIKAKISAPLGEFLLENIEDITKRSKKGNVTFKIDSIEDASNPTVIIDDFNKASAKTNLDKSDNKSRPVIKIKKKKTLDK